ncbi:MAG: HAD-IIIA family hydrolase [Verrucomicrobia bacterium]|nr:HAD-IIIA family hydrolase [Kiritimatiellia bacterium]MCP5487823.1 HAD-IIIA family hydrolase [Verrucomicrobiota bacterium]
MNSSLHEAAARIEALVLDVDGVLTDGGIIYGPGGEWKVFDVQDGHGLAMAKKTGLKVAFLTGRTSAAVQRRAEELKVDVLLEGIVDKGIAFRELSERLGVEPGKICYVGDDLVDLPPLKEAGLAVAVANAVPEVKAAADWVTGRGGGHGAVREVVEALLKARGVWDDLIRGFAGEDE